jgi:hypothetical protein
LRWSESEAAEVISSAEVLGRRLRELNDPGVPPRMVEIEEVHGLHLYVALGGAESVLVVQRLRQPGEGLSEEWTSVGDPDRSGLTTYFLLEQHHTELPNQYRIPTALALDVVRQVFETGERPGNIRWDMNSF